VSLRNSPKLVVKDGWIANRTCKSLWSVPRELVRNDAKLIDCGMMLTSAPYNTPYQRIQGCSIIEERYLERSCRLISTFYSNRPRTEKFVVSAVE
jgi:hypothetical protein